MDAIYELIQIGKYVIGIVGIVGLIVLIFGVYKQQRELVIRGLAIMFVAVAFYVCGYIIMKTSEKRVYDTEVEYYYDY